MPSKTKEEGGKRPEQHMSQCALADHAREPTLSLQDEDLAVARSTARGWDIRAFSSHGGYIGFFLAASRASMAAMMSGAP